MRSRIGMRDDSPMPEQEALFYFAAMSPYSWMSAERIGDLLPSAEWLPVTAAFIFKAAGRSSWGLTDQRANGIADCEQRAREHGLGPIVWPDPWPSNDVPVARAMTFAASQGMLKLYALSAMRLEFLEGADLAEERSLLEAGRRCGIDAASLADGIQDPVVKARLREVTDGASALGVFGVPTVVLGAEHFWGDERLLEASRRASGG
jgi:2-hydroxychromene-2-carboxylate isomerase